MSTAALRHLVVVVPGFGGSILRDADGTPRWGPAFGDIARGMVWADPLSVSGSPDLTVAGMLRTVTVFPPFVLPGYDRLVGQIRDTYPGARVDEVLPGRRRDMRADVVLFPYDFRFGVRPAALRLQAEIEARLAGLDRRHRRQRVIVIGHSMGGLVARYWLGPLGGWPDCRALITLATPHRGVPKALDWLVNGVHIGRVQLRRMTEVSRGWQGVYDLLPRYPAILPVGGRDQAAAGSAIGPLEIGSLAADGFMAQASLSAGLHEEIDEAWRGLGERSDAPALTAVFARGHATPSRIVLADGKLRITKADPEWLPGAGWRGDGTVPAMSAVPPELASDSAALRQVPERHLPMSGTPALMELLRACDSAAPRPPLVPRPAHPWLGVAVDNVVPAGDRIPVAAEVLGTDAEDVTGVRVRVTGAGRAQTYECERLGRQWQAEIPGQRPGAYAISVSASRVPGSMEPGSGQLRCRDVLEVVAL